MKFRNLRYFLAEALMSMFRNRLMSFASIVTVASCTLILGVSYFISSNLDYMLEQVERSMYVVVFIEENATAPEVDILRASISNLDSVGNIAFTSEEEALEDLISMMGDDTLIYGIEDTPVLLRSFSVEVLDIYARETVVTAIRTFDHVHTIVDDYDLINMVMAISRGIRVASIAIIVFLSAVSAIIIINTIKITVSSRQIEINIMKYVGATDSFIRWPFLFEGILIGLFGAILSLIISYFMYFRTMQFIVEGYGILQLVELRETGVIFVVLTPLILLLGIGIGAFGSTISVRKHLRV